MTNEQGSETVLARSFTVTAGTYPSMLPSLRFSINMSGGRFRAFAIGKTGNGC